MSEKCLICDKEFSNIGVHMKMKHAEPEKKGPESETPNGIENKKEEKEGSNGIELLLGKILQNQENMNSRLDKLENKGPNFKAEAKSEDITSAKLTREGVDPRLSNIVDELLGEDFGIEIEPNVDRPGFLFTVVVPGRLSDLSKKSRPITDEDGNYKRDQFGVILEEEYQPEDRRSRAIASHQSFDSIREHCERVRSYIVSYYQKMKKPVPEFKLK